MYRIALYILGVFMICLYSSADCQAQLNDSSPGNGDSDIPVTDTIYKCPGATIQLPGTPGTNIKIRWSTGDSTASIFIDRPGLYIYSIYLGNSNDILTSKAYRVFDAIPIAISLGEDTSLCYGDVLQLESPYPQTYWQDNTTGSKYNVTEPGTYIATATDTCGIVHKDSIVVTPKDCTEPPCQIIFPNAFSPNKDGHNDVFRPVFMNSIADYTLNLYNRWGELIYQTTDALAGWNGRVNGHFNDAGTYYFFCKYRCAGTQQVNILKGDVIMLR